MKWCLRLPEFDFKLFHLVGMKHQAANALSRLSTIGMNDSSRQDYVLVYTLTKAQTEGKKTKTDAKIWHRFFDNDGMDTVKTAMPEVLQVSDETDKELPLRKANSCLKTRLTTTVGKLPKL